MGHVMGHVMGRRDMPWVSRDIVGYRGLSRHVVGHAMACHGLSHGFPWRTATSQHAAARPGTRMPWEPMGTHDVPWHVPRRVADKHNNV